MREPRHHTYKHRTERARSLRKEAPIPERVLWGLLRGRKLGGLKFHRQQPIGRFIVDKVCFEKRLIVELDGLSHVGRADADEGRTTYLKSEGYTVIRVTNDDLLIDQEAVATAIARAAGLNW